MKSPIARFSLVFAALSAAAFAQAVYEIDGAHSSAQFSVRHMMISNVKGEFGKLSGTFSWDPKNPDGAKVEAVVEAATINTRNPKRDAHLQGPDFFDTAKYPTLSFKGKQVRSAGGRLQVTGDLTMHGVTRPATFDVEGPTAEVKGQRGEMRVGAVATAKINRKEWGLAWNRALEAGGAMVGDEVTVTLDIQGVRKASAE